MGSQVTSGLEIPEEPCKKQIQISKSLHRKVLWFLTNQKTQVCWQFVCFGYRGMKSEILPDYMGFSTISQYKDSYCWWTKSCTTKDDDYHIIYRVSYIPGGAGFLPSTVLTNQDCMETPSWLTSSDLSGFSLGAFYLGTSLTDLSRNTGSLSNFDLEDIWNGSMRYDMIWCDLIMIW